MVKIVSNEGAIEIRVQGSTAKVTAEAVTGFIALVRSIPDDKRLRFLNDYFEALDAVKEDLLVTGADGSSTIDDLGARVIDLIFGND